MTHPPRAPAANPLSWLNNQPYLLLSLTSLFWAGNIVLARHVGAHVPPLTVTRSEERRVGKECRL